MREKLCNFSSGLCFEKHSHFLLLQQEISLSNPLNGAFLTIHQEHIIEEAVLQKHYSISLFHSAAAADIWTAFHYQMYSFVLPSRVTETHFFSRP